MPHKIENEKDEAWYVRGKKHMDNNFCEGEKQHTRAQTKKNEKKRKKEKKEKA
jgi:hypothetical protein